MALSVPQFDDLVDVTKKSKVRWKEKNSYILGSIISFQEPCAEMAMLVSLDSSGKELKPGIIMLNFIVSTYLLALEVGEINS